jgi:hypothetical protein
MISGPIVPTNSEGLLELVVGDPERIETGLRIVARGLALDRDTRVDAIGRDAVGRPVAVLLLTGQDGEQAAVRVLSLSRWFARNARFLAGAIPGVAFPAEGAVRIIAIGAGLDHGVVTALCGLGLPDVQVLQIETFRIQERTCFGVRDLTGAETQHDTFDLPSAITAPLQREIGSRFLDLLERLEPHLEIRGDRFGRRFFLAGHALCELRLEERGLAVRLPEEPPRPLADGADVARWFDRVARRYLDIVRSATPRSSFGDQAASAATTASREDRVATGRREVLTQELEAVPGYGAGSPSSSTTFPPRTAGLPPLTEDEFHALQDEPIDERIRRSAFDRERSGRGGMR